MARFPDLQAIIHAPEGNHTIKLRGGIGQVLWLLVKSGNRGLTPLCTIDFTVRLAVCIHTLRRKHGLTIETGRYGDSGVARYRLMSDVTVIDATVTPVAA